MNIILVSSKLVKARTYTVSHWQLLFAGFMFLVLVFASGLTLQYFTLKHAAEIRHPALQALLLTAQRAEQEKAQAYLEEHLNAMAVRLGQMQAQLLRLDALGDRLAKMAGIKSQEFQFDRLPASGGALTTSIPQRDQSMGDFTQQIQTLSQQMEERTDRLGILESLLMDDRVKKKLLPSALPVDAGWYSSNFGWRIDPFTGKNAFHEGVDFMAETGTPIYAAAGGVVVTSEFHPQYGNMIEIDHGNGLVSRYGHASKRLVQAGEVVLRGQKIGEVGSTGRATGPHLHFEVRYNGAAQDPNRFLHPAG